MTKDIFLKYLQGTCSEAEHEQVIEWLKYESSTPSGKAIIRQVWQEFSPAEPLDTETEYSAILAKIHQRIDVPSMADYSGPVLVNRKPSVITILTRVAAILLLPILPLLVYQNFIQKAPLSERPTDLTVQAPPGVTANFLLADGTEVWLNHGSKLTYPSRFTGSIRRVHLTGEGYFAVAHNKDVPFIVGTDHLDVKATGTEFNVSAYREDDLVKTTLVEGKVILFESQSKRRLIEMFPTQTVEYQVGRGQMKVDSDNSATAVAWKDGRLVFKRDSMEFVARKLSRWYNVDINILNPKAKNFTYTATFAGESLQEALGLLALATPITYSFGKVDTTMRGIVRRPQVTISVKPQ